MTLTKLILPGDTLTLERQITEVSDGDQEKLVTVRIEFINQDGQPVQTGEARVRLSG